MIMSMIMIMKADSSNIHFKLQNNIDLAKGESDEEEPENSVEDILTDDHGKGYERFLTCSLY